MPKPRRRKSRHSIKMTVQNLPCEITVIRSKRKTLAAEIRKDGTLLVRAPMRLPESEIRRFLTEKSAWIRSHLAMQQAIHAQLSALPPLSPEDLAKLRQRAKKAIPVRAAFYAKKIGVTYGKITYRFQKTRWGSCSAAGNLNFNCLLMLAPADVLDSVIVHELCHRIHPNHSPAFYAEIYRVFPDYKQCYCWLKQNGAMLTGRLPK